MVMKKIIAVVATKDTYTSIIVNLVNKLLEPKLIFGLCSFFNDVCYVVRHNI
jgi:hypothetical protein